jgi:hypothetical protein
MWTLLAGLDCAAKNAANIAFYAIRNFTTMRPAAATIGSLLILHYRLAKAFAYRDWCSAAKFSMTSVVAPVVLVLRRPLANSTNAFAFRGSYAAVLPNQPL